MRLVTALQTHLVTDYKRAWLQPLLQLHSSLKYPVARLFLKPT